MFSNYAKSNCPEDNAALPTLCMGDCSDPADKSAKPGPYWSLMFEVSESQYKPVKQDGVTVGGKTWSEVVRETIQGAINTQLIQPGDEIVSIYHRR